MSLHGARCVTSAAFLHPTAGYPPALERAQLATGHRGRHEVGRPGEPVDVGVQTTGSPRALELQAVLLECELESMDCGVELARQSNRIETESSDGMMRLVGKDGVQVVDHLHPAGVERGCA